jgi:murein DD-endopeptidase MepM/ murein hydrolase activator NlpD
MIFPILEPVIRMDSAGHGYYGAPRGDRTHSGVDYLCRPGGVVYAPVSGTVSNLGYPYADDLQWRYVQITDEAGDDHRLFYCLPVVSDGDYVHRGDVIAEAQDISERYPGQGMSPHIHYEVKQPDGAYRDPEE